MKEYSIKSILKILLKELIEKREHEQALVIDEFASLIKKQEESDISDELDEVLDNLMSLHHYRDNNDFSLRDEEIEEIYYKLKKEQEVKMVSLD